MKTKIFLFILMLGFANISFAQNQTSIFNAKARNANWGQYGGLSIIGLFSIQAPFLVDDYTYYGDKKFNIKYKTSGIKEISSSSMRYFGDKEYATNMIEIPKHLIKLNGTIEITLSISNRAYMLLSEEDKKKSTLPESVSASFLIHFVNNNGLMEVAGIKNNNPISVSMFEDSSLNNGEDIEIEKNQATGKPYTAVVADETSSIRIKINDIAGVKVKFDIPYGLGSLKYKGGTLAKNEPKIDQYFSLSGGSATVFYHPPRYIDEQDLNSTITINGKQLRCAKVPIKLTSSDINGGTRTETIELKILRPMVVLVHGFTGDASTWAQLADKLKGKGFDTMSENYYDSNDNWGLLKSQDVFAQSRKLSNDIINAKKSYAQSNVKMLKVDVVTHSMGGLIGRYLVNGYDAYNKDVRKLFMVGTPNHGVGDLKQLLGGGGAVFSGSHFGMLADVHEESQFMKDLNKGESSGVHLNPDVEYYNIYGTIDDGVTSESSAYMPGVLFTRINKCCHSPSPGFLSALGTPLTVHSKAHDIITEYLQKEIMRLPLKNVKAYIIQEKGEVWVDKGSGNRLVLKTPYAVSTFDKIRTKENSALTIAFTVNGTEFGRLITGQNTSLQLKNYSPQTFTVRVVKGKARFKSSDGHFQVEIQPDNYSKFEWYNFSPKLDLNALGTTFDVIYETDIPEINLIEGEIRMDDNENGIYKNYSTAQSLKVVNNNISTFPLNKDSELNQVEASAPPVMKPNPLFANVKAGGMLAENGNNKSIPEHNPTDNSNNSSNNTNNDTGTLTQNCVGSLSPKFLQKVGAPSDARSQMIVRKIDDENKREIYLFNKAKADFQKGIMPTEMSGTYRYQQNPSVFSRSYQCMTVTLFAPMKITGANGNSQGFSLMREGQKYKSFNTNSDAVGTVLPCGSYKAYPNETMGIAVIKLKLEKVQ